jgi:saccharopine dehydrogenase-like NADP-dependent oxidoreductase
VRDLLEDADISGVIVAELNPDAARAVLGSDARLQIHGLDVTDREKLVSLLRGCVVVINSTRYTTNMDVMQACLEAGAHYLDLGGLFHMTRRQLALHDEFKSRGLTAVLGCGSTPGITNVMAARACCDLDTVRSVHVKIGCADFSKSAAPLVPPYSMETILDEFSLKPMIFDDGEFKEVAPLSGEEEVSFPEPVGTIRACYTLHSEVATFPLSYREKGIRSASFRIAFPSEFYDKLKLLVELGFAREEKRAVAGVEVSPRKLLLSLLNEIPADESEPDDCDVIRVEARGTTGGRRIHRTMESIVRPHSRWKVSAGALDTGVPASIIAQMIAKGVVTARGVYPPETCIDPDVFFRAMAQREMRVYSVTREELT